MHETDFAREVTDQVVLLDQGPCGADSRRKYRISA
jgi:ABC-type polar amino acid transport system ATPase subunit